MMRRRFASAPVLLALVSPNTATGQDSGTGDAIAPGSHRKIVLDERAGGFRRSFRLYVPKGAGDGESRPLVVAIHGGLATARILAQQTNFDDLADRFGFYVAYPNGLGIFSLVRHWNGGFCCAQALGKGLDDVGFVDRVIEWTAARHAIDSREIYVVGFSNGGFLAYWYAAQRADRLAGLGIWASTIGSLDTPKRSWTWTPPAVPLPAFIAHGTADPRLPWDTGSSRKGQELLGAVASAEAWAAANGCEEPPSTSRSHSDAVERRAWCEDGPNPVVLLGIEDWGHSWPGPRRTDRLDASHPLRGFHLAEEMWSFFAGLAGYDEAD